MEKTRVKLLLDHEHGGIVFPAGAFIELDADQAQRLIAIGRALSTAFESSRKSKPKQEG